MAYIVIVFFVLMLTVVVISQEAITNDLENVDTSNLENELKSDTLQCEKMTVFPSKIYFTFYNKKYQEDGILLDEAALNAVDPNERVIIIIHGWQQSGTREWVLFMKDTYLHKYDFNIIVVDWSTYAGISSYNETFCTIPHVGSVVGDLIYNLNTKYGVNLKKFQINGFSFGAQVAGYAGKRVFNLTGSKIERINGLDAAGPLYNELSENERLDKSDANFVQAIHTNGNKYGCSLPYATVDFYVNSEMLSECGTSQRGCPLYPGVSGNVLLLYVFCSHIRSVSYFIESINSDEFVGVECESCGHFKDGLCLSNTTTVMGENCPSSHIGVRYLNTNYRQPFAQGIVGMENTRTFW